MRCDCAREAARERVRTHAVHFGTTNDALEAVRAFRSRGYTVADVHSPFAVHGMDEALGLPETRVPWATFIGGALGCSIALVLQTWTHAVDWPLDIGGKTNLAGPGLVPVVFELTVLLAAFGTVGALLVRSGLFPRPHGRAPASQPGPAVTDDSIVVLIEECDGSFVRTDFRSLAEHHHATKVVEDWSLR